MYAFNYLKNIFRQFEYYPCIIPLILRICTFNSPFKILLYLIIIENKFFFKHFEYFNIMPILYFFVISLLNGVFDYMRYYQKYYHCY